jgi:hypothetical protein
VLHSNVKLHPLLAFVSVLGGIQVMGLWGIFIGPIVASCLHALIKIFNTEIVAFSEERQGSGLLDRELSASAESKRRTASVAGVPEVAAASVAPSPTSPAPVAAKPAAAPEPVGKT